MNSELVHTTVEQVMMDFLEALNALVPTLRKVKILDHYLTGDDGWEMISQSLFTAIVEDTILRSLKESTMGKFKLVKYGFVDCDPKKESFIQVIFKINPNRKYAFGGFTKTGGEVFNRVIIQEIVDSKPGEITKAIIDDVDFSCAFFNGSEQVILKEISFQN